MERKEALRQGLEPRQMQRGRRQLRGKDEDTTGRENKMKDTSGKRERARLRPRGDLGAGCPKVPSH